MLNNHSKFLRQERFYDAKNNCVFDKNGNRKGPAYDNYEIIDSELKWAIEARKGLKD